MSLKAAARVALHKMGGLAALRQINRRKSAVLAFHSFSEATQDNVEAICAHVTKHFEVLSLSALVDMLKNGTEPPNNALAVTVDDGYRNYLLYGHPIFRKHKIPTTLFAVSGFAAGRLWLWPDQIEFGIDHSSKSLLTVDLNGQGPVEFAVDTPEQKADSAARLTEMLKVIPNPQRLSFMAGFGALCGVEIPAAPPPQRAAMTWDELRAIAAEGTEIGCHTESHPILTRLESESQLQLEIKGAKESLEQSLGRPVRHFCYPNGKADDLNDTVVASVREAGFDSAVTCLWGLNTTHAEPLRIQRLPFDSTLDYSYAVEVLAGLHV